MITKKLKALLAIITPILSLVFVLALLGPQSASALPQTFTVTNTNDSGAGSLRQAIADANGNGNPADQDIIEFDISGLETKIINLTSSISITEPVIIDGYTQGNATQNTALFPEPLNGVIRVEIILTNDAIINVTSDNVGLKGLAISRDWAGFGVGGSIIVSGADNFSLTGSYLGTDFSGLMFAAEADAGNDVHLEIIDSQDVLVGGSNPEDRNIFMYCSGKCITAGGSSPGSSSGLQIKGNYMGLGSDGITVDQFESLGIQLTSGADNATIGGPAATDGNMFVDNNGGSILASDVSGLGIYANRLYHNKQYRITTPSYFSFGTITLLGVNNSQIGSSTPGRTNFIAGSWGTSIYIGDSESSNSSSIVIEANTLGYSPDGLSAFTNRDTAIRVAGSAEYIQILSNTIHNSSSLPQPSGSSNGIEVSEDANNVSITQNSIYDNSGVGINLNSYGNDDLDIDSGPNDGLNYPEWYSQQESGGDTIVDFTADLPAGDYRVEFYSNTVADPSGRGEGEVYLGYTNISSAGSPNNFSHTLTGVTGITNLSLTATEIDGGSPNGFGATSEFGGEGVMYVLPRDLSIEKTLDDPQNYAPGNTVQYTVTLTNTGDNSIDLTTLDGSEPNPLAGNLFVDYLAPGMTLNSVVSGDALCNVIGTLGSVDPGNPAWANHQDHTAVFCAYTGANTSFEPNESISVTISVDLALDFDIGMPNTATPGHVPGDLGPNVTSACFSLASEPGATADVIDCVLADTSGNADIAQNEVPHPDLTITKTLTDPQDFVQNGQVTYTINITNDGTLGLDLSIFDGSGINPLATSIFVDYLPPGMSFVSNSNSDISCSSPPATLGDIGGVGFANHADYGILPCTYIGTEDLAPAEEISTEVTLQISNDSNLNYTNYVTPGWAVGDPGASVQGSCLTSAYSPGATQDVIDCLITDTSGEADIAQAGAPTDIAISQTFSAPNGVSPGSAVSYTYTFTNNGPGDVSLPWYRIASPLFINIFPGEDLTFVNSSSTVPGVECLDIGPGSAIFAGTVAEDHASYNLVSCGYSGTDNVALTSGQSIVITLNATVNNDSDGRFTNYIMHASTPSDPDSWSIYQLISNATSDLLDTIEGYPMFSRLSYPLGSNPEGGNSGSGSNGDLSDTGESIKILVALGLILMLAAGAMLIASKKKTASKKK